MASSGEFGAGDRSDQRFVRGVAEGVDQAHAHRLHAGRPQRRQLAADVLGSDGLDDAAVAVDPLAYLQAQVTRRQRGAGNSMNRS